MEIRINTNTNIRNAEFDSAKPVAQQKGQASSAPSLSITEAPSAVIDDTMGIDVSEESMTRTDALGKLITSAFSLPAPPMPEFK